MMDVMDTLPRPTKGKVARRIGWAQLPALILQCIIADLHNLCHREERELGLWRGRQSHWHQAKFVFFSAFQHLKMLRAVCSRWRDAVDLNFEYWDTGFSLFDPDNLWEIVRAPIHGGSGARHPEGRTFGEFASLVSRTCLPCAINTPLRTNGSATRYIHSRSFGYVGACQAATHNPDNVCGVCMRDINTDIARMTSDGRTFFDIRFRTICGVEDQDVFGNAVATCKMCRLALFLNRAQYYGHRWRGHNLPAVVEGVIENYLETGEGTIKDMIADIEERYWFARETNYNELHESALACERMRLKQEIRAEREAKAAAKGQATNEAQLQEMLDGGASPDAINRVLALQDEEDEEDEEMLEEDYDAFLSSSEEVNITDMALSGWVRNRILDGCWLSPWDIYNAPRLHHSVLQKVRPAFHPVDSYSNSLTPNEDPGVVRPAIRMVQGSQPPSRVFTRAQALFEGTLRQILLPAMDNLVQRLIYECELNRTDVCKVVASLQPYDVLRELHQIHLWGVGYKWEDFYSGSQLPTDSPNIGSVAESLSSEERDRDSPPTSNTSATTHCTTPPMSPPSTGAPHHHHTQKTDAPKPIQVDPPPIPTRWLSHIPYIPQSHEHIGVYCWDMIAIIWREACSGLFKCQCRICERASGKTAAAEVAKERVKTHQEAAQPEVAPEPELPEADPTVPSQHRDTELETETEEEEEEEEEEVPPTPTTPPINLPKMLLSTPDHQQTIPRAITPEGKTARHTLRGRTLSSEGPLTPTTTGSPTSHIAGKPTRRRSREEAEAEDDVTTASSVDEEALRDRKKVRLTP